MPHKKQPPRPAQTPPQVDDDAEAWERQAGESDASWRGFVLYRDMQPKRSLSAVARALNVSKQSVAEHSSRQDWRRRVLAYEAHLDRTKQAEVRAEIERLARNNVKLATMVQARLGKALEGMKPDTITPQLVANLLKAVSSVEATARGSHVYHHGHDGGAIEHTIETRKAIKSSLLRKLGALTDPSGKDGLD